MLSPDDIPADSTGVPIRPESIVDDSGPNITSGLISLSASSTSTAAPAKNMDADIVAGVSTLKPPSTPLSTLSVLRVVPGPAKRQSLLLDQVLGDLDGDIALMKALQQSDDDDTVLTPYTSSSAQAHFTIVRPRLPCNPTLNKDYSVITELIDGWASIVKDLVPWLFHT